MARIEIRFKTYILGVVSTGIYQIDLGYKIVAFGCEPRKN